MLDSINGGSAMFDVLPSALPRAALPGAPGGAVADGGATGFASIQLGSAGVTASAEAFLGDSGQGFGGQALLAEADPSVDGEAEAAPDEAPTEQIDQPRKHAARLFSDLWRAQIDPETLQVFTEIVNPFTRSAMYRLPPLELSEEALAESLTATKREYQELSSGGEV